MTLTCGDLFAGGGGFSLGARAAGLTPIWAIESDSAIAEVYGANLGAHVIVEEAQHLVGPHHNRLWATGIERPDVLLASPPCQSHSNARSKKLAPRDDAEVGLCILDYVRILRPRFVFIENVEGWKRSHSFKAIFHGLHECGYWVDVQVLNAADFGVPQTRKRLFLRASREGMLPALPPLTPWKGWYQAIEDLIPGLPESKFADWQLKRLPELLETVLVGQQYDKPQGYEDRKPQMSKADSPAMVVTGSLYSHGKMPTAFIVRASDQRENCNIARPQDDPIWTLTEGNTAHGRVKAFLVDGQNAGREISVRDASEPAITVTNLGKAYLRAWLSEGRVVAMNPRALARFMGFPDSYIFPEGKGATGLACRVIGNAVCSLLAKRLLEPLTV
jgi:DNA (cytosine-5)-methyltransferase 1